MLDADDTFEPTLVVIVGGHEPMFSEGRQGLSPRRVHFELTVEEDRH